jgi:hypothetical protein
MGLLLIMSAGRTLWVMTPGSGRGCWIGSRGYDTPIIGSISSCNAATYLGSLMRNGFQLEEYHINVPKEVQAHANPLESDHCHDELVVKLIMASFFY